jgi:hypothetical protein
MLRWGWIGLQARMALVQIAGRQAQEKEKEHAQQKPAFGYIQIEYRT